MPALENQRHEAFAQACAQGMSTNEAFIKAGYTPNRGNATRLKANEVVKARIAEIMQKGAARAEITIKNLVRDLMAIALEARANKQSNAAVAAIREIAVLTGLRVEKSQATIIRRLEDMSDEELLEITIGQSVADPAKMQTH